MGSTSFATLLCFVVCAQFIPESARFNVSTGNTQAALATLEHIARMNRSVMPEGKLVEPVLVSSHGEGPAPHRGHLEIPCPERLEGRGPQQTTPAPGGAREESRVDGAKHSPTASQVVLVWSATPPLLSSSIKWE